MAEENSGEVNRRSEAQLARRERERSERSAGEHSAKVAEAAAARAPEGPVDFQADPGATADAFQEAGNKDDAQPRYRRGNPVRTSAYDEIMASRQATAQEEAVHEERRPDAEPVSGTEATPEPAPSVPVEPEAPKTVRAKVDGVEFDVPESEVEEVGGLKAYQLIRAAHNRLEEGRRQTNELTKMFQAMQAQQAQNQKPPEPPKPPQEVIKDAVQRIQFGNPDEAAQAFIDGYKQLAGPQIDERAVALQAYLLNQVTNAESTFVAQNQDLVTNPMLRNLVLVERQRRLEEIRQNNRLPDDWNRFYNQIAVDIRAAIGRPPSAPAAPSTASQPTSGVADKEARKASIVALPSAAARAAVPVEDKPPTREDILARARKARGQPV